MGKFLSALGKALGRKASGAPTGGTGLEAPPAQPLCPCGKRGCANMMQHYKDFKMKP